MPLPFEERDDNPMLLAVGRRELPSTMAQSVGAAIQDPRLRPTQLLSEYQQEDPERFRRQTSLLRRVPGVGVFTAGLEAWGALSAEEPKPEDNELWAPDRVKQVYGHLGVSFDQPTPRRVVEMTARRRREDMHRDELRNASPSGIVAQSAIFGAGLLGAAVDPLNIASAFIPVVGEANFARMVGTAGVTAARLGKGAVEGAVGALAVEPVTYGLSKQLQLDYSMNDALLNIAFGTILGGGLHVTAGAIGDRLGRPRTAEGDAPGAGLSGSEPALRASPEALESALRGAVSQFADGRPVDVAPIFEVDKSLAEKAAAKGAMPAPGEPELFVHAKRRPPLSREEKAEAVAPHQQSLVRMHEQTDWSLPPPPEVELEVKFDLPRAEQLDTDALEMIEQAMDEARAPLEPVAEVEGALRGAEKPVEATEAEAGPAIKPFSKEASQAIPAGKVGSDGEAGVFEFDATELKVDAKTFQFKEGGDAFGVTSKLRNVTEFSRTKAGQLIVWERADGEVFVANGHQRVGLARRVKKNNPNADTKVSAVLYREKDGVSAQEAMVIAAAANIAEGSGNVLDMAKIGRLHPERVSEAMKVSDEKVSMAQELMQLSDEAFRMVTNEVVPYQYAAIVGRLIPDDEVRQKAAIDLLAKADPASKAEAESLVRQVRDEALAIETQTGLFGEEVIASSLAIEKSKVEAAAESLIRQDRKVFSTLVKEAGRIEEAGNKLAADVNAARAQQANEVIGVIKALAYRKGPISDALTEAAQRIRDGAAVRTAARGFLDSVRRSDALGGAKGVEPSPQVKPRGTKGQGRRARPARELPKDVEGPPDFAASLRTPDGRPYDIRTSGDTARIADSIVARLPEGIGARLTSAQPKSLEGTGLFVEGGFDRQSGILFLTTAALDPVRTLRHEEIHVLRHLGQFTEQEWQVLVNAAGPLRPDVEAHYRAWNGRRFQGEELEDSLREEAVARMVEAYNGGARFGGVVDQILQGIVEFFERLRNAARGLGYHSVADIIRSIESGDVGARGRLAKAEPELGDLEGVAASTRDMTPEEKEVFDLLEAGAAPDVIQAHPLVQDVIARSEAIPPTHLQEGFGGQEWRAAREFNFDGETVVGWDNALERLVDSAKAFAGGKVRNEKKATILLGPPAAGKSAIAEEIAPQRGAAIVDPDEAKKVMPEFGDGIGATAVHEESGLMAGYMLQRLGAEGANVILPKVGGSAASIRKLVERIKAEGYTVELVIMRVDEHEAFRRSVRRFLKTRRLVTPSYMREIDGNPEKTYLTLKEEGIADGYAEIDNNKPAGVPKEITGNALSDVGELRAGGGGRFLTGLRPGQKAGQEAGGKIAPTVNRVAEIADNQFSMNVPTVEKTAAGDQLVIPGAEKIKDKQLAERKFAEPKKSKVPQKESAGPLFEEPQADLVEMMRTKRADEVVQKAQDLEGAVKQAARCMNLKGTLL